MKKISIITLGILLAIGGFAQSDFSEQFTVPLSKPGERGTLKIDHMNGDIIVTGYSGKEVIISAKSSGNSHVNDHNHDDDNVPAGMKRLNVNPVELKAREENNKITVHSDSWKRRLNLEIKVPANMDLDIHSVHGIIKISGVNGAMDISAVNGELEFSNVSGSIVSNTVNGDVKATFKSITSGEPMSFVTLNGNVDVTLPASVKASAKVRSDRGDIYTDFDMTLESSKTDVKKSDGQYEVSINTWVYGKINGGGPEYTFKNMQGDIIIRKGS
ncbi:MAG: DUF4097 family beta strand repeat-containing protein [Marinoscillum sp.]